MSFQFSISVHGSQTFRCSDLGLHPAADTVVEQSFLQVSEFPSLYGRSSGQFDSIAKVSSIQHGARLFVSTLRTAWANTSVEPTATSHTLRHEVTGCSITPSRLLLSHPARRRSALVFVSHFSQVAVAHLFR